MSSSKNRQAHGRLSTRLNVITINIKKNPGISRGCLHRYLYITRVERICQVEFSNHPLNKQSTIDNRQNKRFNKSTIDYMTDKLRVKLNDPLLGAGMVALALSKLGEAEVESISNYAIRKATHPGKVFVTICNNTIKDKS